MHSRSSFRHTYTFDDNKCIVLLKDATLKNVNKHGFLYYSEWYDSYLTDFFMWEIEITNFKQYQAYLKHIEKKNRNKKAIGMNKAH